MDCRGLFIALSLAYAFNRYSTRVYNVKSTLLIRGDELGAYSGLDQALARREFFGSWRNLENEIAILESIPLNYRVIEGDAGAHVAYVPVNRNGIQGQRMYITLLLSLRSSR